MAQRFWSLSRREEGALPSFIAIDGITSRGAAEKEGRLLPLVAAVDHEDGRPIAQTATSFDEDKQNGLTAARAMIKEMPLPEELPNKQRAYQVTRGTGTLKTEIIAKFYAKTAACRRDTPRTHIPDATLQEPVFFLAALPQQDLPDFCTCCCSNPSRTIGYV